MIRAVRTTCRSHNTYQGKRGRTDTIRSSMWRCSSISAQGTKDMKIAHDTTTLINGNPGYILMVG